MVSWDEGTPIQELILFDSWNHLTPIPIILGEVPLHFLRGNLKLNWLIRPIWRARWPSQTSSNLVMLDWSSVFSSPPVLGSTCATLSLISLIFSSDSTRDRPRSRYFRWLLQCPLFSFQVESGFLWLKNIHDWWKSNPSKPQQDDNMAFGLNHRSNHLFGGEDLTCIMQYTCPCMGVLWMYACIYIYI